MTETERKALALVNEVSGREWAAFPHADPWTLSQALCRAIEQHEAYRQEVSEFALGVKGYMASVKALAWQDDCDCFIIAKPDPLVEVINDADDMVRKPDAPSYAEAIRAALAARGLKIVEDKP